MGYTILLFVLLSFFLLKENAMAADKVVRTKLNAASCLLIFPKSKIQI
jgi:hypothetical protein